MESSKINNLLDKYFEAETTTAEEDILKAYFAGNHIAEEHIVYQPLFKHFTEQKQVQAPEWKHKVVQKRKPLYYWISVAAAVVLIFAIGWQQHQKVQEQKAELAYHQAKEALKMLSLNLNKGISELNHVETFENTIDKIFK